MRGKSIFFQVLVAVFTVVILVVANFLTKDKTAIAYVDNQKLFNEYLGTKELQDRLLAIKTQQQVVLDSMTSSLDQLTLRLSTQGNNQDLIKEIGSGKEAYSRKIEEFTVFYRGKEEEYTQQLWTQINQYVYDFGAKKGYDYLIGANGDGSLMYAKSTNDITEELLQYINDKYDGKGE